MNKILYLGIVLFIFACKAEKKPESERTCNNLTVDDFSSFISVDRNTQENKLKNILGKATGGSFTDDKLVFIYEFSRFKRIPIHVYVNAELGKVQTVSLEVLGLNANFETDLKKVKSEYSINDCHAFLLGKQPEEIIKLIGKPSTDNLKTDNVESNVRTLKVFQSRWKNSC